MNLPNKLTVARLFITGIFVATMSFDFAGKFTVSLVLFLVASITDYLDGAIARKRGLITTFGKLMDPLADKVLMGAAFILLSHEPDINFPAWAVVVILTRELLVTGLRLVATSHGAVLAADSLGKQKTVLQIVTSIYFLLYLASTEAVAGFFSPLFSAKFFSPGIFGTALITLTIAATVISGVSYLWKNRQLLADS
ncbi:MAG: CDP-diacylglycerol--glycerol-3-phosphate 3-phosphatidyltransferase [Verrucomicrobiales bacterium]|nr:CDP-diacylglycerol--glycerol-3-phosphate 3-phosphatidyltransferase [Verrucomicrobiales bacterium]